MGGICLCCCTQPPSQPVDVEFYEKNLSAVVLDQTTEECYVMAHTSLVRAVEQHRSGASSSAFEALIDAEKLLEENKDRVPQDLQMAYDTDPHLAIVKQHLRDMIELLEQPDSATHLELQASVSRVIDYIQPHQISGTRDEWQTKVTLSMSTNASFRRSPTWNDASAKESWSDDALASKEAGIDQATDDLSCRRSPSALLASDVQALDMVSNLCMGACVFEAARALRALELDVASTCELAKLLERTDVLEGACQLGCRLKNDPVFVKLRSVHGRFDRHLDPKGLLAMATRGSEKDWVVGEIRLPDLGEHFRMKIALRFAQGDEYDKKGPTTQVISRVTVDGWPMKLHAAMALERETDLIQKEWIPDCKFSHGTVGGPEQLMSAMIHQVIRPALLPISFEHLATREFAVCREAPFPGFSPGVLVVEESLPRGELVFEGWRIPPEKAMYVRMSALVIKHIAPSAEFPGLSTMTLIVKAGVPVSKFMVPLGLLKKIAFQMIPKALKSLKDNAIDRWEQSGYNERVAGSRDFYETIAALESSHVS